IHMKQAHAYRRLRLMLLAGGVGIFAALIIAALVALRLLGSDLPLLETANLDAAEARWNEKGPASYDLVTRISGGRAGEVRMSVRNGEVIEMSRDGVTPKQRRTWDTWSVPGMFETMRMELEARDHPEGAFGQTGEARVSIRAKFDPTFGYPTRYE